jgi:glycosyltransferase involved in cell wall biosynthesis
MNICMISRELGMLQGGGETNDLNLSAAYEKLGAKVTFITRRPLSSQPNFNLSDRNVVWVRTPYLYGMSNKLPKSLGRFVRLVDSLLFNVAAARAVRKLQPDVVQVTDTPALSLITWLFNKPLLYSVRGKTHGVYKRLLNRFDGLIFWGVSRRLYGSTEPAVPSISLSPGVDSDLFKRVEPNGAFSRLGVAAEKNILFVGRFVGAKNLTFLISAFKQYVEAGGDADLTLIGDGPLRSQTVDQVDELNLQDRVVFGDFVPAKNLAQFYSEADVLVLTSHHENFPIVILEAMSCGLPVIAPSIGGIPDMVTPDENGYLYDSGDVQAFVGHLKALLSGDTNVTAERCMETVEEVYSWDGRAGQLLDFVDRVITPKK